MAGNATARRAISEARKRGETPDDIYHSVVEQLEEVPRADRAWLLGYLARIVDRPGEANPHDPEDGPGAAELAKRWAAGWREGEGGDFEALAAHARRLATK